MLLGTHKLGQNLIYSPGVFTHILQRSDVLVVHIIMPGRFPGSMVLFPERTISVLASTCLSKAARADRTSLLMNIPIRIPLVDQ